MTTVQQQKKCMSVPMVISKHSAASEINKLHGLHAAYDDIRMAIT